MKTTIAITLTTILMTAGSVFAADAKVSKEERLKMAEMHMKMAECLKSDKPMGDCHQEMAKGHKGMCKEGCPMMGKMKGEKCGHCEHEASEKKE